MSARYVLAPRAAQDLVEIWRYIKDHSSVSTADRVESVIRDKPFCRGGRVPDIGAGI